MPHIAPKYDIIIRDGRVIDPETGFDEVCDLAITGDRIVKIGQISETAPHEVDATGLIVAPGFIDLHAHGQSVAADRMQAFDGVTTTLELEAGTLPVAGWYARQAGLSRALNYGTAAAWLFARKAVMGVIELNPSVHPVDQMGKGADDMHWSTGAADEVQTQEICALVRQGLEEGAIGIGIPYAYAPGAGAKEMAGICALAHEFDTPTFTHIAYMSNIDPQSSIDAYVRLIGLAGATGAHMHICHMNSTSLHDIENVVGLVEKAQQQGLKITTEAYPYGTASTVVSAGFFSDPDFTKRTGSTYSDIELVHNHHRFTDRKDLARERSKNPANLVMWHFFDTEANEDHRRLLDLSVTYPGGCIASDAMPWVSHDGRIYEGDAWPLPDDLTAHPRSSATFTRFLRQYARERETMPLMEAIAKCTLLPAKVIEACAPQIRRKARLQEGCDADIVVFDFATITDRADFTNMNRPSEGVRHLLVNGTPVITDGKLDTKAAPGLPIRRETA